MTKTLKTLEIIFALVALYSLSRASIELFHILNA
jgi:hypothetical protein